MFQARSRVAQSRIRIHCVTGLCLLACSAAPVPIAVPDCRSESTPALTRLPAVLPDETNLEEELFRLINLDRAQKGLRPLDMDSSLARMAHDQSRGMAALGYISHEIPSLGGLDTRLDRAGYSRRTARENVARAATVAQAESVLAGSPEHARNLLATDVTRVGVGVVHGGSSGCDELYITQIFAQPSKYPPPLAIHESFLSQVAGVRREKGIKPLRLDPIFGEMARYSLECISLPFDRDAFQKVLADAVSDLKRKDIQSISRVTVHVQFVRDAKDMRIPDDLSEDRAQVLGVGVRETQDSQRQPIVVMLSFIGFTD